MTKMFAVLKREYFMTVRKKTFIIMTFLLPFLMAALFLLPGIMVARGMGEKKVAVLDGTGALADVFRKEPKTEPAERTTAAKEAREALSGRRRQPQIPSQLAIQYIPMAGDAKPYLTRLAKDDKSAEKLHGVFVIPANALTSSDTPLTYYSRSSTDIMTQERLARITNRAIQRHRLAANGINVDTVDKLTQDLPLEGVQLSKSGQQKKGGEASLIFAMLFGALLLMPSFMYGNEIMRGIVQEKSERVVEVLVSSMRPIELLTGKIMGIAAVGLTQIGVWMVMISLAAAYGAATAAMAGINVTQFVRPEIIAYFLLFFVLAYLTYVCIYAIAGAVSNTEREAQQFMGPITIVMLAPWIMMFPIITNPDSPLAVAFSLAPVFGPFTMFVRALVADPPAWHFVVSVLSSLAAIVLLFWATAKIFRVGILSYGKRATIPELWRWMKVA